MNSFPFSIIDAHAHIYPAKIAAKAVDAIGSFYNLAMNGVGTSDDLVASGARAGITHFLVHSAATVPEQVRPINDSIAGECAKRPGAFCGFGTLHPALEDLDGEIDHMIGLGLRGIKLHPDFQKFSVDAPELDRLYDAAAGRLPILFHAGDRRYAYSNPHRIAKVAERHPDLKIVAAHFGGYSEWKEASRTLYGLPVMFDTSSSLFELAPEEAAGMIRSAGVEKFMFGSDYPMWNHLGELKRFLALPLTEEERKAILHDNAARFLGLDW